MAASCLLYNCKPNNGETKQQIEQNRTEPEAVIEESEEKESDTADIIDTKGEDSEVLSWEDIPSNGKAKPLDFEKWLIVMKYIDDNYWARPTAKMVADAGLEVLYETDEFDEDSIKSVHFIYGRETKCMTDSVGEKYHTFNGDHAVLFEVFAYTSSGAELHFHSPADLRDFMEQAIKRGLAVSSGSNYIVCEEPLGSGLHKVKNAYRAEDKRKGTHKELFYLHPVYKPNDEWQTCYVSLDFLPYWLEVE